MNGSQSSYNVCVNTARVSMCKDECQCDVVRCSVMFGVCYSMLPCVTARVSMCKDETEGV